jgi:HEAT repeat protein
LALYTDLKVGDEVSARALKKAAQFLKKATLQSYLDEALSERGVLVRCVAIELVGESKRPGASRRLAAMATGADAQTAMALARALAALGEVEGERGLLDLFEEQEATDIRLEAISGLAKLGTAESVEPLIRQTKGFLTNAGIKSEARRAINRIQARIGHADGGRLTVTEHESDGGELALAREAGDLSLADKE